MHFFKWGEPRPHPQKHAKSWSIPQGTLRTLVEDFDGPSCEDIRHFGRQEWLDEISRPVSIELRRGLIKETQNLSLERQLAYVAESGCRILSPYEIVYLAQEWARSGKGHLFEGRVRTQAQVSGTFSHLAQVPTVVIFYDEAGKLRFGRENPGCARKDLGVLAGIYRD